MYLKRDLVKLVICGLFLIIMTFLACSRHKQDDPDVILAKVADRTITLNEFLKRSEYTIRPAYAKSNTYIHKKIILNSLIAEKLFSLEAGDDNPLMENESFRSYIKGRKEQAMRKWLYQKTGYDQVKLDSSKLAKTCFYAGREYKVAYFSVGDSATAMQVENKLQSQIPFEQIYHDLYGIGDINQRTIKWQEEENDRINDVLFSDTLKANQVIGPIKTEDNLWTTMKILDWNTRPAISESQKSQRLTDVRDRLIRREALRLYSQFAAETMRGKRIEFVGDTFWKLVDLLRPIYLVSSQDKAQSLKGQIWQDDENKQTMDDKSNEYQDIKDEPVLKLDSDVWTVEALQKEIDSHPLVFRTDHLNVKNFPEQIKLAIVDLVRDRFLTQEAYKRGYDKTPAVRRETEMWQDHFNAHYYREQYLKTIGDTLNFSKDYLQILDKYLNPYVEGLEKKYSDKIYIDTDILTKLKLTQIDLLATERNVPFPLVVPAFPVLTTDNRLDYGQKLDK
jgi:hypothetical protein